jgi:hypothetical protein
MIQVGRTFRDGVENNTGVYDGCHDSRDEVLGCDLGNFELSVWFEE